MLNHAKNQEELEITQQAGIIALELSKWFTEDKTLEEVEAFLLRKSYDPRVRNKAVFLWYNALTGVESERS